MAGAIYRAEFLMIEDKSKDPHTDLADPEKGKEKSKETKTEWYNWKRQIKLEKN